MFSGLILDVPAFQSYEDFFDKYKYFFKFMDLFKFYFSLTFHDPNSVQYKRIAPLYPHYYQDEKLCGYAKMSSIVHIIDE